MVEGVSELLIWLPTGALTTSICRCNKLPDEKQYAIGNPPLKTTGLVFRGLSDLPTSLEKPPIFEPLLRVIAVCKYGYINQLYGQSQISVSGIKVSFL
jgi:hypothetical protein